MTEHLMRFHQSFYRYFRDPQNTNGCYQGKIPNNIVLEYVCNDLLRISNHVGIRTEGGLFTLDRTGQSDKGLELITASNQGIRLYPVEGFLSFHGHTPEHTYFGILSGQQDQWTAPQDPFMRSTAQEGLKEITDSCLMIYAKGSLYDLFNEKGSMELVRLDMLMRG